ncbi:MAG: dicarboxylate/amino acid:cation symporter, partial [Pirellulales bacterium]|nr:dicarboxylate/amino acid:cation symporter [Pirellulales bacterium]
MSEKNNHGSTLAYWIFGSIIAAIVLALTLPEFAMHLEVGGEIFLRLLRMIVVPLVFTAVLSGILGLGDVRKLGKPGGVAIGYYLCTTLCAVLIGLVVVNVIQPGVGTIDQEVLAEYSDSDIDSPKRKMLKSLTKLTGLSESEVSGVFDDLPSGTKEPPGIGEIFRTLLLTLVTDNLIVSAAETQLLPIIVFAIIFGAMLTTMKGEVTGMTSLIDQSNAALMKFVMLLMNVAPLGIFCLVASRFGEAHLGGKFWNELTQIGWYFGTVLLGLGIHALVVLPLVYWVVRRENP